jgi:hypothetical protein
MFNDTLEIVKPSVPNVALSAELGRSYSLIQRGATGSRYSDPTASLEEPRTLFLSHEKTKAGVRNSVLILRDRVLDADQVTIGKNDVMVKMSSDINVVTKQQIAAQMARAGIALIAGYKAYCTENSITTEVDAIVDLQADAILSDFSVTKFLNEEH